MSFCNNEIDEKILQRIECPFTWNLPQKVGQAKIREEKDFSSTEIEALTQFMKYTMKVYFYVTAEENSDIILKTLEESSVKIWMEAVDKCLETLKQCYDSEISIAVLEHIFKATKYFVHLKTHQQNNLTNFYQELKNSELNLDDKKVASTLNGCKGMAWDKIHKKQKGKAEEFFREAIKDNPACHSWYYYLGKKLRRIRRDQNFSNTPLDEEEECFMKAYEISKSPLYGIYVAQMYREKRINFLRIKALKIYKEVLNTDPDRTIILLRLALGFIQYEEFELAKYCLDKVEVKVQEKPKKLSMYHHYRGIYYYKEKNNDYCLQKAEHHFGKAVEHDNLAAEWQYMECKKKLDESFDLKNYLLKMLDKYVDFPNHHLQKIILEIAFIHWKACDDIDQAFKYFLLAIEKDPKADCLKNFSPRYTTLESSTKNIFEIIIRDLLKLTIEVYYPLKQNE